MPDTCIDCGHLREAGATYYYCGISGQTLGYEPEVDESAWAGDDGCPLDRYDGDHSPLQDAGGDQ
jgi:hypothetical protein